MNAKDWTKKCASESMENYAAQIECMDSCHTKTIKLVLECSLINVSFMLTKKAFCIEVLHEDMCVCLCVSLCVCVCCWNISENFSRILRIILSSSPELARFISILFCIKVVRISVMLPISLISRSDSSYIKILLFRPISEPLTKSFSIHLFQSLFPLQSIYLIPIMRMCFWTIDVNLFYGLDTACYLFGLIVIKPNPRARWLVG